MARACIGRGKNHKENGPGGVSHPGRIRDDEPSRFSVRPAAYLACAVQLVILAFC
jgi:hypothetical protein